MARRKFELPGIQDLSKEQEAARALPKEGQHLIVGGPGAGKSVLALIRARRHLREDDDYIFLVFNHLLNKASSQLFGDGFESQHVERLVSSRSSDSMAEQPIPLLPPQTQWVYVDIRLETALKRSSKHYRAARMRTIRFSSSTKVRTCPANFMRAS